MQRFKYRLLYASLAICILPAAANAKFKCKCKDKSTHDLIIVKLDESGKLLSKLPDTIHTGQQFQFKVYADTAAINKEKRLIEKNVAAAASAGYKTIFFEKKNLGSDKLTNLNVLAGNDQAPASLVMYYQHLEEVIDTKSGEVKHAGMAPFTLAVDGKKIALESVTIDGSKYVYRYNAQADTTTNSFDYQLTKHNRLPEIAIDWYNQLLTDKKTTDLLRSLEDHVRKELTDEIMHADSVRTSLTAVLQNVPPGPKEQILIDFIDKLAQNTEMSAALNKWIASWVWLNGDKTLLNPFSFTTTDRFIELNRKQLARLHMDTTLVKAAKKEDLANYDTFLAKEILPDNIMMQYRLQQRLKDKSALALDKFVKTDDLATKAVLPLSAEDKLIHLRHYYNKDLDPLSEKTKYREKYPEGETIAVLVHNLKANEDVNLAFSMKDFTDSAAIDKTIGQAITIGSSLLATVDPGLAGVGILLSNVPKGEKRNALAPPTCFGNFTYGGRTEVFYVANDILVVGADSIRIPAVYLNRSNQLNTTRACDCKCLVDKILLAPDSRPKYAALAFKAYYSLVSNIPKTLPMPSELTVVKDTVPNYRTKVFRSSGEVSKEHTYVITKSTLAPGATEATAARVDSASFKIGRRTRFEIMAGLAYTFPEIRIITVDTTGDGLESENDEDRLRLIAGVRFYPFQGGMYVQDSRVWPLQPDRISFMAAVGIPKPLDNFYFGLGYDIVPGLQLNGGLHLYRYVRYEVTNGAITNQSAVMKPRAFVGITMNPLSLVKLLQTL